MTGSILSCASVLASMAASTKPLRSLLGSEFRISQVSLWTLGSLSHNAFSLLEDRHCQWQLLHFMSFGAAVEDGNNIMWNQGTFSIHTRGPRGSFDPRRIKIDYTSVFLPIEENILHWSQRELQKNSSRKGIGKEIEYSSHFLYNILPLDAFLCIYTTLTGAIIIYMPTHICRFKNFRLSPGPS